MCVSIYRHGRQCLVRRGFGSYQEIEQMAARWIANIRHSQTHIEIYLNNTRRRPTTSGWEASVRLSFPNSISCDMMRLGLTFTSLVANRSRCRRCQVSSSKEEESYPSGTANANSYLVWRVDTFSLIYLRNMAGAITSLPLYLFAFSMRAT